MVDTRLLKASVPDDVRGLCTRLRDAGFRAWVVGGCVRDHLLAHLRSAAEEAALRNDWDVATDAHPEQVQKLFKRVIPTGIKHGTVTVLIKGVGYEVTTLRGEAGYSDGRRPDAVFFVDDIVADLARRDFTINAMAYDPLENVLIDPFAGRDDLVAGVLRAVGDAAERFAEDGLRVLRAARFAATLEMDIEARTAAAIEPSLDSYRRVSPERVREEWVKSMKAERPSRAFLVMQQHGLLAITAPELAALAEGSASPTPWAGALAAVDRSRPDVVLRMAVLLADLGAEAATALVERLRFSNAERDRIAALVRHQDVDYAPPWSDVDMRRYLQRTGVELVDDLLELVAARARPERAAELSAFADHVRRTVGERPALAIKDLAVRGADLIAQAGLSPGPAVGQTLRTLLDEVVEDPRLNERDALLARARQLAGS